MSGYIKVAEVGEIPAGKGKAVQIQGRDIAILNAGERYYAVDNLCPHKGGPLAEGIVMSNMVVCPWHRWPFELETGSCTINGSAVDCFEVKVQEGAILVKL